MKNLILRQGTVLRLFESNTWTDTIGLETNGLYTITTDTQGQLVIEAPLGNLILVDSHGELTLMAEVFKISKVESSP